MTASVQQDALLAKFSVLAYKDKAFLQDASNLPTGWVYATSDESGAFFGVAFKNEATNQVIIAYRGTDGLTDGGADASIFTGSWNDQFQQGMNFVQSVKALPGFENISNANILVTGHSLGGAIAQIVVYAYGFDGSTIDPGGAGRIVNTPEFAAAAQAAGLPPTGLGAPASFNNWLVAGSTVSGGTGPQIGDSNYLPSLTFSGEQALKAFLVALINPAVGMAYIVGTDQFSNKHASEQISQALGLVASGQDGGSLPSGNITLVPKILGYDTDEFTGESRPVYSQGEFEVKDASGAVLSTVKFFGQGADRKMEIYDTAGALKTTIGTSADGKTITTTTDTNYDGNIDQYIVTDAALNDAGQLTMTVERDISGHRVKVEFVEDEWGDLKASRVLTVDGQAPASAESFANALNTQGYSVWDFADGQAPSGGSDVGSLYTAFNPMQPTGAQTLTNAINQYGGTLIDALSIIKAIQSGDPLPIAVSGLRLANDISNLADLPNYNLSGAASVGSSILSVLSLEQALQRGDTMAAVTAGAQAISFGAQAYANFATGLDGGKAIQAAFGADSAISQLNQALPYLNLVNSIAHGDEIGVAVAVTDMVLMDAAVYSVPYVGWAYAVYSIVSSLFGDEDPPPEPWGSAAAGWAGFGVVANAAGEHGGYEAAQGTMNQFIAQLNSLASYEQSVNPGSAIGVVANRLPSITYRNYSGFQLTDIDPITGVQRNPEIKYDLTGRPYNAPPGSDQASQSLSERFIRVALARGAVAPMWEVQTSAIQTQYGDPQAGLTEEERAGRNGQLSTQDSGLSTQVFRAVALDLNGDGVQTTGTNKTVAFDVDDSGFMKNTAWLDNNDGFLFLDRNLNGSIDSGRELFSNSIVDLSARGLAGMRWIDSNYDGKLTAADPVWNELKIWQDADGDGQADAGETKTLSALGITALDYAMGRFERNGQLQEMRSPDLAADTVGTRTHVIPEGIVVETTSGHTSLLVTRIDDKTMIEANRDGVEAANEPLYFCERIAA